MFKIIKNFHWIIGSSFLSIFLGILTFYTFIDQGPINLTEKAIKKIRALTVKSDKFALRLDLKKGGCAGMEYFMEYVDKVDTNEEVIDFKGAKVIIAPLAQMYLFGTTIDYEDGVLESGFKFNNPNVSEACGCGESIKF